MILLAQTIPGTEVVPVVVTCSIVGLLAGVTGLILTLTRARHWLALAAAFAAVASVVLVAFFFLRGHGFSLEEALSAVKRHWLITLLLALPLVLAIGTLVVYFSRRQGQT